MGREGVDVAVFDAISGCVQELKGLPHDDIAKIMGANLAHVVTRKAA